MPAIATPDGITLEYEELGSSADPAMLLVMGFGAQLIAWPRAFAERLAAAARHVVLFDNRDCGLSSKLDGEPPDIAAILAAASSGDLDTARSLAPYTLSEMAADGFALLTALGIEQAHLVGASMGGMIAQTMAIEHPERVLTLTSMMSNTGEPGFGEPTPEASTALLTPSPPDRAGYVEAAERSLIWRSRRYPELEAARELAGQSYDRCYCPEGVNRQLAAMLASGSRDEGLRELSLPTLVIHGLDDTLIAPSGGERTATLVPDASLLLVEDMGHDRPVALWPQISQAIIDHTTTSSPVAGVHSAD
ncbi:MAG TPA: alpha/beta hydrolase [Solirubrobacteraceae bacterium]|nr:alpha/beta hydrolase [Solirubrobacteraceae bacterium]